MAEDPHGTPSWIELNVPDPDAAAAFYARLFGWEAGEPSEEGGGYRMFLQGGAPVAGLMRTMSADQPVAWSTYVSVDDADATAAAATAAGATLLLAPMDVMDLGRMAFLADPSGAAFGLWQPSSFGGAELVNVPVSFMWTDIATRDRTSAVAFYGEVFGWKGVTPTFDTDGHYTVFQRPDGGMVGGTLEMTDDFYPAGTPAHWSVNFAVADTDATVAAGQELGAEVLLTPMNCPIGRFAGLRDPFGATFAIMALNSRD